MIFHAERPIYMQLMDEIKRQIAAGRLAPGAKIDSIRELAAFYAVNPNTVQRALSELERNGLLSTKRASGKMVTEDTQMIEELRSNLASERIAALLSAMESLGFSAGEIRELFDQAQKARSCQMDEPGRTQGGGL
ncbi:MAG: GntR family transcriptional regulator [Spirochaetaceae bacterium]|jgi:DNA-binding transcriptional regulator YhcF (GntR family)|nr:GntR family transcriptional regulator [Spirochaetaceae bacterium]